MLNVLFYERQSRHRGIFALGILIGVLGLVALLPSPSGERPLAPERGLVGIGLLGAGVFLLNRVTVTTWVYEDRVRFQFGRVFPWGNTYVWLDAIEATCVVEGSAMEDEESSTVLVKTGGAEAVRIETEKRSYVIGSRHAEKFRECVEAARK